MPDIMEKAVKIADHYGFSVQFVKLSEECAEFAAAQLKFVSDTRADKKAGITNEKKAVANFENAVKEMADVFLLVEQIRYLLTGLPEIKSRVEKYMNAKANRQLKRIREETKVKEKEKCPQEKQSN